MNNKSYLYIAAAGIFWAVQGVIGKFLSTGLTPMQIAFCRVFVGFLFIFLYTAIKYGKDLRVDREGLVRMAIVGLICQSFLNICFFYSVTTTSVSAATALLYTAPIFAMIISRFVFNDRFTPLKVTSLVICSVGCFLTVTMGNLALLQGSAAGILAGLGSGLAYSLNSIFGKKLMGNYNPWTILTYSFGFGSLFMAPFCDPIGILPHLGDVNTLIGIILLGFIPTFLAFGLYFTGIAKGAEPSKVGIVATIEVAISVALAFILFDEPMGSIRMLGIAGIFTAVYILYLDNLKSLKSLTNNAISRAL